MKETLPIKLKEPDFNEYGFNMSKLIEIAKPRSENAIKLSKERMKRNPLMEECRKLITPEIKRNAELSSYIMYILDKLESIIELRLIKKAISHWPKFKGDYVYKSKDWIKVTKRKWKIN